jgi:hypothetical protein
MSVDDYPRIFSPDLSAREYADEIERHGASPQRIFWCIFLHFLYWLDSLVEEKTNRCMYLGFRSEHNDYIHLNNWRQASFE